MEATAIIPYLGYKNAPKAIEWLCNAFGFEVHLVVPADNGLIVHAELKLDKVMIMLGSAEHIARKVSSANISNILQT